MSLLGEGRVELSIPEKAKHAGEVLENIGELLSPMEDMKVI